MKKILIANRGEISLRVIRTARDLGLSTVSVFTPIDQGAAHTLAADQTCEVDSYLNIPALIEAAQSTGAEPSSPPPAAVQESPSSGRPPRSSRRWAARTRRARSHSPPRCQ